MTAELSNRLDAAHALLDRQIVDVNRRLVAKVDDLLLGYDDDGRPYVVAMLTGPGALGPRLGGRLGGWVVAVWRRLHPAVDPQPVRIPMATVARVDSAVHLAVPYEITGADALARWVDAHFIGRIPGADRAGE